MDELPGTLGMSGPWRSEASLEYDRRDDEEDGPARFQKPARRIVDPDALPLYADVVETAVAPATSVITKHHVVARSQGGDDLAENLVWVDGDGTTGTHGVLETRCRDGATGLDYPTAAHALVAFVRARPPLLAYVQKKKWVGYLEDTYLTGAGFGSVLERAEWLRAQGRDEDADELEAGEAA